MPNRSGIELPDFLRLLPRVDVGIAGVTAHALRGPALCVLFEFSEDVHVPEHAHGAQLGYVLSGALRVVRGGAAHQLRAGDSYLISAGEAHEAWISSGTVLVEFFEDADRY